MDNKKLSESFQKRLKRARTMRQWSQHELAKRSSLPQSSIANFEIGSRKPSFDNLRRLSITLEITTDYLLGRVNSPEMSKSGDPLFRDVSRLTGDDLELAQKLIKMLAKRNRLSTDKKG